MINVGVLGSTKGTDLQVILDAVGAKKLDANIILNKENSLNLMELVGFVKGASYVISNDTGPAHISSHLDNEN